MDEKDDSVIDLEDDESEHNETEQSESEESEATQNEPKVNATEQPKEKQSLREKLNNFKAHVSDTKEKSENINTKSKEETL